MNARLKSLAYRMLGSNSDAEDIVQEAYLRLHQADPQPDSTDAFLYRTVSNLCIDQLRRLKTQRKHYPGPWLPEPYEEDDGDATELAEELSIGFMLLLETLPPAERIAYVLREGFDYSFPEIAELLAISPASARQRASRARARLRGAKRPANASPGRQQALMNALMLRMADGDVPGLIALMTEDVVAYTDGGGVVSAAIRPVTGRKRIAQVALHLLQKAMSEGAMSYDFQPMNGSIGLVMRQDGRTFACMMIDASADKVRRIYIVRNPEKLKALS